MHIKEIKERVAMEMERFHIAQTTFFLGTIFFCIYLVPVNNLVPMKNCPVCVGGWSAR